MRLPQSRNIQYYPLVRRICLLAVAVLVVNPFVAVCAEKTIEEKQLPPDVYRLFERGLRLSKGNGTDFYLSASPRAFKLYNEIIRRAPNFAPAYIERGYARASCEQFKAAIADYDKAIALNPSKLWLGKAYSYRGFSHSALMQDELALSDLEMGRKLGHSTFVSRRLELRTLTKLHKYDKAEKLINILLAQTKDPVGLTKDRAQIYSAMKKYDLAIADYNTVVNAVPNEEELVFDRGKCLMAAGKYKDAIRDFSTAIKLTPLPMSAYYAARADAYRKIGDSKASLSDEQEAKRLKPTQE